MGLGERPFPTDSIRQSSARPTRKRTRRSAPRKVSSSPVDHGVYILVIDLPGKEKIKPGKLEETEFPEGLYLYVGRARKGLRARISRHLGRRKKSFWHVDYLLQTSRVREIWYGKDADQECPVARQIQAQLPSSSVPSEGFGSSDCRCRTHLFYLPRNRGVLLDSLRKELAFDRLETD